MLHLYLRMFSSNSNSRRWMTSALVESCVHYVSAAFVGPVILKQSGRFGGV
jgi:hypothetical protein